MVLTLCTERLARHVCSVIHFAKDLAAHILCACKRSAAWAVSMVIGLQLQGQSACTCAPTLNLVVGSPCPSAHALSGWARKASHVKAGHAGSMCAHVCSRAFREMLPKWVSPVRHCDMLFRRFGTCSCARQRRSCSNGGRWGLRHGQPFLVLRRVEDHYHTTMLFGGCNSQTVSIISHCCRREHQQ